ncbi:hypothetical protein N7466_001095 [Penicillium verhagenii]|uniref:uncharacterized protein n=1 Tax=Penicillium verhagenii TaxID=1562060 RepID=UPI002544DB4E|nr:uncharacterized protein N7466_001095 [Penicillium verhagenii]KAJ5948080.1 hypothetical protein N7466_001095 [Penicillium verhagenii]
MTSISSAKLRTRTGCLQCRNRRKKCDELRPQCAGCRRNQLQCIWPSNEERKDGRIRQPRSTQSISFDQHVDGLSGVGTKSTSLAGPTLRPPVQMPSPFQLEEHCYLYRYFGSDILPRLVRRNSLARYADQSYKLRLALEFPPLMGALISTSAMQLACVSGKSIHFALKTYTQTINGLRQALDRKIDFVSHDALLATVITLSVFEVGKPNCLI